MKKFVVLLCLLSLILPAAAQESAFVKQSLVINIEIPVRVFDKDNFIDSLTIKDFEVYEEGVKQKIEAVYLVKKRSIERSQENKRYNPETERNFFLFFEIAEYLPRVGEALDQFINSVITPGDNLTIITPLKTYGLRGKALEVRSRADIAAEIKGIVRKDTVKGNSEYRRLLEDMEQTARTLSSLLTNGEEGIPAESEIDARDPDVLIDQNLVFYSEQLHRLDNLRKVDQYKLLDFARYLKLKDGQKYVFMFYQREFIPQIEERILSQYLNSRQDRIDWIMNIAGLNDLSKRDITFDVNKIKQNYADASTSIHFLFITQPREYVSGVTLAEHSEDIFSAFREMAYATGGVVESGSNPVYSFQKALEASENYYLLYYSPKEYAGDGEFKSINVRVKNKSYRIIHRTGYFSY